MFLFNSSREHDLIFCVGSDRVSGAVAEFRVGTKPRITHAYESRFPIKDAATGNALLSTAMTALHKTAGELTKSGKKQIGVACVILASPWFSSFSQSFCVEKDEEVVVSEKFLDELADRQVNATVKKNARNNLTIIEKAISDIKLNGYRTSVPYLKSAKTVEISVYASSAPMEMQQRIESEIYKVIHPASVVFHTLPFFAWNTVARLLSPNDDFFLIDVGGEISDVLISRRGAISTLASFPVGTNHLVRKIATHFETSPALAESIINLCANGAAETGLKDKTESLITAFGEEWTAGFRNILRETETDSGEHFPPQRAYLISHQNFTSIMKKLVDRQIPNTVPLTMENISQFIELGADEKFDVFTGLSAIHLNSQFNAKHHVYNHK